jgi:hypothetical protein
LDSSRQRVGFVDRAATASNGRFDERGRERVAFDRLLTRRRLPSGVATLGGARGCVERLTTRKKMKRPLDAL